MKIFLPDALSSTAAPKAGDVQSAQWRKALEQAQWQARQRIARDAGSGNSSAETAGAGRNDRPDGSRAGAAPQATARAAGDAAQAASGNRVQQVADAVGRAVRNAAAARNATSPVGAMPAMSVADPLPPGSLIPAEPEAPAAPLLAWQELPEWPAVVVYASVTGNRVSVGMRDRSVAAHEVRALFERLRAQLRATGLELTHLVINGQQVSADDIVSGSA